MTTKWYWSISLLIEWVPDSEIVMVGIVQNPSFLTALLEYLTVLLCQFKRIYWICALPIPTLTVPPVIDQSICLAIAVLK